MRFLFALLFISSHVFAQDLCLAPTKSETTLDKCLEDVITILSSTDNSEVTMKAGSLFLEKYQKRTDFDVKAPTEILKRLKKYRDSEAFSDSERSKFWLMSGIIHGRMSDKLRANGGAEHGRESIKGIKTALVFDKNNKSAAIAYAHAVNGFKNSNSVSKFFIEKTLEISIAKEVQDCLKAMEVARVTSDPMYSQLKSK